MGVIIVGLSDMAWSRLSVNQSIQVRVCRRSILFPSAAI
jgi:hypothetical protein